MGRVLFHPRLPFLLNRIYRSEALLRRRRVLDTWRNLDLAEEWRVGYELKGHFCR
jgi:hypothetical protein